MNYVAQSRTPNAGALFGALAIPAGFGALLIAGLAVTYVLPPPEEGTKGFILKPKPIETPPPPEIVEPKTDTNPVQTKAPDPVITQSQIVIPGPDITVAPVKNLGQQIITLPPPSGAGEITGPPILPTLPDPIAAIPRGDPGSWIMERDYRSRWIRENLSGVASFTLEIDTRGKVSECTITRSTGHDVLDGATCRLLTRRARFNPARNSNGDKVTGTYSSSVAWEIP